MGRLIGIFILFHFLWTGLGAEENQNKNGDKPQAKEDSSDFKFDTSFANKKKDRHRQWKPTKCKSRWRKIREECNDPATKGKYAITFIPYPINPTYKKYRDQFKAIDPKNPLKACMDEIIKTAVGNMIMIEEFEEFIKSHCISLGAGAEPKIFKPW